MKGRFSKKMSEKRNGFIDEIRDWAKKEEQASNETIKSVIEGLPKDTANEVIEIQEQFYEGINQIEGRYCERPIKGIYQIVKNAEGKTDFVFPESIYAVKGENEFEGIVERVFTKRKRYKSLPKNLNDETLAKINKETGHNFTRFELLLLAGYVFVNTNSDGTKSITCCEPAVDFIEQDYLYTCREPIERSVIKYYKFKDFDGKELDKEEIEKLVGIVMNEIDNEKTVDISQGDQR